jgi:hypothetical protein
MTCRVVGFLEMFEVAEVVVRHMGQDYQDC